MRKSLWRLSLVGMLVSVVATALPAVSVAKGHAGRTHAAKKKKGKKKTTVLVRCAVVTVTCKGTPGPQGPQGVPGKNGTNGTNGTNGLNGSAVILRATGGPATTIGGGGSGTPVMVPMTNNTWTQQPGETDLVYGTTTITPPGSCSGGGGFLGRVLIDGKTPGALGVDFGAMITGAPGTSALTVSPLWLQSGAFVTNQLIVFEVSSATPHTLTATVQDNCTSGGERFTLNSINLWVAKYV